MKVLGLGIIVIMICSLISSVALMNMQVPEAPEINNSGVISMTSPKVGTSAENILFESKTEKQNQGMSIWYPGETILTRWDYSPSYMDLFTYAHYLCNEPMDYWDTYEQHLTRTREEDGLEAVVMKVHSGSVEGGVDSNENWHWFEVPIYCGKAGTLRLKYDSAVKNDPAWTAFNHSLNFNITQDYLDYHGIAYIILENYWDGNSTLVTVTSSAYILHDNGTKAVLDSQSDPIETIPCGVSISKWFIDVLKFTPASNQGSLRSEYQYVSDYSRQIRLTINCWEYGLSFNVSSPLTYDLVNIQPTASYYKVGNNYIVNETIPTVYVLTFHEELNQPVCIKDISSDILTDIDLEAGLDWQQNVTELFDSVTTSSSIIAYGARSLKLVDTDNNTDCLNITTAIASGTAFISFKYYIESLEGNFTFMYYNDSWQKFYLQNITNRWQFFQDFINITDDSISNVAFQLEGNAVIYLDGFRVYNTTMQAYTTGYQQTKLEGYVRNWDALQDPLLTYEDITIYLKNNTNTLQIWTRETNDLGYFSVLSNYSFNAQQYHIEVVTSTTSLTQNSSTTYLIPDYDFPPNFDETVLWTKMDKGSGTNVSDSSGNGHHGTAMNGVGWTTGINGSALDFENSSSHYVNFTDSDDFSFSDGAGNDLAFTIEFWLKLESGDRSQYVIAKWDHVGDNREYRIWIGSDNKLYVRLFNNDSADYIGRASSVALATGSWYYLVLVYDGSESDTGFALYLNGTLDSSSTSSSSGSYVGMTNGDDELEFGRTLTGYFLDGILDDVRIHKNLTLSASQIAARFTNYSYYDPTRGEYYIYSSSSTSKSIEQKSYFTPLNITSTASITYSESETYFLLQSTNETLLSRVWFNGTYSGDYFIGQFIPKNTSLGTHNFSFVTFMADQQYVYLPTSLTSYIYTVTLAFAVYIENFYLTDENCYLYMIANKAGSYTIYENDSSVGSGSFTTTGTNIAHTRNQAYGVVIFLSYKFTSVSEILWFNTSYINTASVAWAVTTLLFSYDLESNYIYVTYYSTWANTTYRVSDNDTSLGNLVNEGSSSWSFTDDAGYHIINISIYNSALFLQNFTYGFTIIDDFSVSIENFYLTDKNCYLYVTATRDGSFEIYENDTLQSSGSFLKTGTNIAHTRNQAAGIVVFLSYKFMSGSDIQWFNTTYINTESIPWEVDVLFFTYDIDYGIISTTYISNWANTTYRMADNGTWLGSAQSEGSHTWTFDITSGYHNITLTAYNGAVVLDTIEFAISIPLTPWEVDVLVFTYDASFGIISTTYISNWANTTHRLADNGTWLASAQVEGSFTWPFTTTVGYHNITMHVYNGVIELDVIEFGFTILPTLVYWQVFFTFVDQNNLPLFFQFGKIYVNGSQQLSQYLTILDGSVINVNITDNFNQNLLNQSYTVTSDLTISVEVTVYLMYFLNSGSYPGEVVVYKDAIAGYNFSIPSLGNQPLYFLAGNYLYQVYYRTVSVQAGVTIVASAKTAYGDLRKFSVGEDYSQYVDASTPRKPSDTTETPVSAFAGTVTQLFSFIIILLVGGFGIVLIRGRSKVVVKEKEVIKGENK